MAVRYQRFFEDFGDVATAVIMSPPDTREGYENTEPVCWTVYCQSGGNGSAG